MHEETSGYTSIFGSIVINKTKICICLLKRTSDDATDDDNLVHNINLFIIKLNYEVKWTVIVFVVKVYIYLYIILGKI